MNNQLDASKLLHTLAQQDTEKRHASDSTQDTSTTLPIANTPDIIAWLRSLAPLTEADIYNNSWKDQDYENI